MRKIILDSPQEALNEPVTPEDDTEDAHSGGNRVPGEVIKVTIPETPRQASVWAVVLSNYIRFGLCHTCASQAAWGHQNGFSTIKPPCSDCLPLVKQLPVSAGTNSPWKRFHRGGVREEG